MPVSIRVVGGHSTDAPIVIDASSASSRITISGVADSFMAPPSGGDPFLTIRAGSPPVSLSNLTLTDGAKVRVDGGDVSVEGLRFLGGGGVAAKRRLSIARGADGSPEAAAELLHADRPITLHGGVMRVRNTVLSGIGGGGILVTGGSLLLSHSEVRRCRAARGAALRILGGNVTLTGTLLEDNTATDSGGAVEVAGGGTLTLSNQTRLRGNSAHWGSSLVVSAQAHSGHTLAQHRRP